MIGLLQDWKLRLYNDCLISTLINIEVIYKYLLTLDDVVDLCHLKVVESGAFVLVVHSHTESPGALIADNLSLDPEVLPWEPPEVLPHCLNVKHRHPDSLQEEVVVLHVAKEAESLAYYACQPAIAFEVGPLDDGEDVDFRMNLDLLLIEEATIGWVKAS